MINYIKTLFRKPTEIYTARNMKNSHYFLFILGMGMLMTFFSLFSIKPEFDKLSEDFNEIKSFLPDFELVEGTLESEEESYIYQTDNILFYFDPEDRIDTELIDKNMKTQTATISVGLMKKDMYVYILNRSRTLNYSEYDLTAADLNTNFQENTTYKFLFFGITLLILFVFNLFLYATQLLSISIFANLTSAIERNGLKFFQNAKIALMASMIPFLLTWIANALQFPLKYQYELVSTASLILFFMSVREFKNRLRKQMKSDKKE